MYEPNSSPYQYIGDVPALGSLALTKLAKSFEETSSESLAFLFPTEVIPERNIIVRTVKQGLGLMPIVMPGVPTDGYVENDRIETRYFSPIYVRDNYYIDQHLLNQLRRPESENASWSPTEFLAKIVQKMVNRHNRTVEFFRVKALLGGINHTDPRSNLSINVSTQVPAHNMFRYDGWNATLSAAASAGHGYTADKALTNNKGRTEAMYFSSLDNKVGVPWTSPNADIVRTLRLIKQYLASTNKNVFTDIVMSRDLYTILQENTSIKSAAGQVAVLNGASAPISLGSSVGNPFISYSVSGDITSIAGLNIILVDSLYSDPSADRDAKSAVKQMWSPNKVALVARTHSSDRSATLGYTQFCMGESPDSTPGMWTRTEANVLIPGAPGMAMQMGNAFLPYVMYPHWIAILEVCEEADVEAKLFMSADIGFGTF